MRYMGWLVSCPFHVSKHQRERAADWPPAIFFGKGVSSASGLRIGAALEGGAIIVGAVGIVARGLLLGLLGLGAQRGLAGLIVLGLARKHDVAEAGLDGVEFRRGDDIFLPGREDASDFLLRILNALRRGRMRGEDLGDGARAALLVGLDALEEGDVGIGVVAGFIHVLQAEEVRFALGVAAELQIGNRDRQVEAFIDAVAGPAPGSEKDERDGGQLHQFALGGVLGAVARGHVGNLVGHHAGKLGLFLCAEDQAAVHIEEAAGEREGVDFVGINNLDGEGNARVRIAHQVLADAVDVFGDHGIVNQLRGALDFLGQLLAQGDFALQRVEVHAFANAAIADGLDVFLGILWIYGVFLLNRLGTALLLRLRLRWLLGLGGILALRGGEARSSE